MCYGERLARPCIGMMAVYLFKSARTVERFLAHGARMNSFATSGGRFIERGRDVILWGGWRPQRRDSHCGGG